MFSNHLLRQGIQTIKTSQRFSPSRRSYATLPPPVRSTLWKTVLPVTVGIIASSCAFVTFAPLIRLDGPSSSNVRRSSASRSKLATWTEEDQRKWRREEVLQAFLDSPSGTNYDLLGLLAVLLVESYSRKGKLDKYEILLYTACQRLGQLRISGLGYWGRGRDVQERKAEWLAECENIQLISWKALPVRLEDLPLTNEDVKTALVGLLICSWITWEFTASRARAKKEGKPSTYGLKFNDSLLLEHVKSSDVMANLGPTEIWILRHTIWEAEKVLLKPEVQEAFAKAGCLFEDKEVRRSLGQGKGWVTAMLDITKEEHHKYAAENIIRHN